jgi:predicted site-specific integrase-resolvase
MKLSKWCKEKGICYQTGLNWFHKGLIPNVTQLNTGTILVDENTVVKTNNKIVTYSRVSNNSRKKELDYQVKRLEDYCSAKGYSLTKNYKEVASGMNDDRRQLWKMLDSNPTLIVVENKDRLTRFGFNYIERLLKKQNCIVEVVNRDHENETDLIKDLVSIVTSFCCRLYGIRRGQNKIKLIKDVLEVTTEEVTHD